MEQKIGIGGLLVMLVVALAVDGLQALLNFILIGWLVNPMLNVFMSITYAVWCTHHNVPIMSRGGLGFFATFLVEFLPISSIAPLWTMLILATYAKSKVQET